MVLNLIHFNFDSIHFCFKFYVTVSRLVTHCIHLNPNYNEKYNSLLFIEQVFLQELSSIIWFNVEQTYCFLKKRFMLADVWWKCQILAAAIINI